MKKYLFLASLVITFLLIIERVPQMVFNPDEELFLVTVGANSNEFSELKTSFLLWRKANPLFTFEEGNSSTYGVALRLKNYKLICKLSEHIERNEREEYFIEYGRFYDNKEKESLIGAMLITVDRCNEIDE